ncbi:aldo/keto reductase [Thermohalobacter berrensis]|uniref:Aldo/keto reductase n=1 Tax=Thermohalobacter berrensis TaxID=99594 RepID=A0A419TAU8_9FIRM|nr:aldo/keto reductase [Thermohalobacter berrensis]RKD34614.1 aldo/keto reductase [Thermohalobacter berrensis]
MKYTYLGNTNIKVSKLCFGSLTIGPLQRNFSLDKGAEIIRYGINNGINFIDTAELYETYSYISKALKGINREKVVIATKSYSYSKKTAQESLNKALKELNTDYIDIFLLHEQESELTIKGHYEAIEYFINAKKKGLIRSIGISTHRVEGVLAANKFSEIEVIHPIINIKGIGIQDGTRDDMLKAIKKAYDMGKGIYGMKPLGGGHLINNVEKAFNYVNNIKYIHSIAVGMQSFDEVDGNIKLVETGKIPETIKEKLRQRKRRLLIHDWCVGCGKCAEVCKHGGLSIINNKATPNYEKCIFCGYCANYCPEFCIKVI